MDINRMTDVQRVSQLRDRRRRRRQSERACAGGQSHLVMLSSGAALLAALATAAALLPYSLDDLVRTASDSCEALPLDMLFTSSVPPRLDVTEYTRGGQRSYKLSKAHKILQNRLPSELIIYIPGWWNTPTDESSKTLASALLQKAPLLLIIDTRSTFFGGYISSAAKVNGISQSLYKFIHHLHYNGYSLSSIHLIGFSLGAHVAGITGKLVQNRLNQKIGRITGLDPARPCFAHPSEHRLQKRDAKFVQVIHTSIGVLGVEQPIGDADVYVNGLSLPQPECREQTITLECDHAQSWKLYSASVTNEQTLVARKCKNWSDLSSGHCNGSETVMGYECTSATRGIFLYKSPEMSVRLRSFNPFSLDYWFGR